MIRILAALLIASPVAAQQVHGVPYGDVRKNADRVLAFDDPQEPAFLRLDGDLRGDGVRIGTALDDRHRAVMGDDVLVLKKTGHPATPDDALRTSVGNLLMSVPDRQASMLTASLGQGVISLSFDPPICGLGVMVDMLGPSETYPVQMTFQLRDLPTPVALLRKPIAGVTRHGFETRDDEAPMVSVEIRSVGGFIGLDNIALQDCALPPA